LRSGIDQLCISMSDLAERSSQVRLMSQIYSNACRVLVWLGDETPLSHVGMQSLSGASRTILHDEEIAALDDILSRPIWLRSWLIQEIVVAKRVVVRCGPICMDWDDIRGLDWLKRYILSRPRDLPYRSDYEFHDLLKKCNAVAALQDLAPGTPIRDAVLYLARASSSFEIPHVDRFSGQDLFNPKSAATSGAVKHATSTGLQS
jgi:hypothetical protein